MSQKCQSLIHPNVNIYQTIEDVYLFIGYWIPSNREGEFEARIINPRSSQTVSVIAKKKKHFLKLLYTRVGFLRFRQRIPQVSLTGHFRRLLPFRLRGRLAWSANVRPRTPDLYFLDSIRDTLRKRVLAIIIKYYFDYLSRLNALLQNKDSLELSVSGRADETLQGRYFPNNDKEQDLASSWIIPQKHQVRRGWSPVNPVPANHPPGGRT